MCTRTIQVNSNIMVMKLLHYFITEENYNAYTEAAAAGNDTTSYFTMWIKLGELSDIQILAQRIDDISFTIADTIDAKLEELDLFGYEDLDNTVIFAGGNSESI